MIQIFILGSSSAYGAGAISGWGDLIKQSLHKKMYGRSGVGEKYEVYNFGKSGATIEFVLKNFSNYIKGYGRKGKTIAIVSVGGNNAKAENKPDNFVSTIEEYSKQMSDLLDMLKRRNSHVIVVGSGYYDESKTNPKPNPLTGGKSYFSNKRMQQFQTKLKELCNSRHIIFIGVDVTPEEWQDKYLHTDGLHPNQAGHKYISNKVIKEVLKLI